MSSVRVTAQRLRQKDTELYMFGMNSATLRNIAYSTPRGEDNPEEVQRILSHKRAETIGRYIQDEGTLLPNAILISLNPEVTITPNEDDSNMVTIEFPSDDGKFAKILDGQHRVAGFEHCGDVQLDLPIIALHDAPAKERGKLFADINSKQVKVTDVHLLSLYYQLDELGDGMATMRVVENLAAAPDSPLNGRIKMRDEEKGAWVKNKLLKDRLAKHIDSGGVLVGKTTDEKSAIFKAFFQGVKDTWPGAWGNNQDYRLTKAMGIEILIGIFDKVKTLCDMIEGRQYSPESFARQLSPLVDCTIQLSGGGEMTLDWRTGVLSGSTNRSAKSDIISQLIDHLTRADEALVVDQAAEVESDSEVGEESGEQSFEDDSEDDSADSEHDD